MKTLIIILFTVCLVINIFVHLSYAQWFQQQIPINAGIALSIDFTDESNGVTGGWYNFMGRAMYTSNGGSDWAFATVPDSSRAFVTVEMIDSLTGYMAGAYNIFGVQKPAGSHLQQRYYSTSYLKHMEAIGMTIGDEYKGMFLKTIDGGRNWITHGNLPSEVSYLVGMDFIDVNNGILITSIDDTAYNMRATTLKTTNGGLSWTEVLAVDSVSWMSGVEFINEDNLLIIGYGGYSDTTIYRSGGMIFRSTDFGQSWSLQFFLYKEFDKVFFTDDNNGILSGYINGNASVYRSTNQGINWQLIHTINEQGVLINGISFYSGSGTGMIYGSSFPPPYTHIMGWVSRTTNYGTTWGQMQIVDTTSNHLIGAKMISVFNHYISGGDPFGSGQGVIYHTANGGIVSVNSIGAIIPGTSSLMQSYPNPFNPNTIINYELRVTSYAKLVVYDIMGREILTLVNEKQSPGTYQVEFDGSGLPSGVYFYRLVAGEFTDTKRMMLVK